MIFDPLNLLVRWLVFVVVFLFLTYLFREKVILEGSSGYLILLFIFAPANLIGTLSVDLLPQSPATGAVFFFLILGINLLALYLWSRFVPGLAVTGWRSLVLFALLLSIAVTGIFFMPRIPTPHLGFHDDAP
jgi:hypothetical protein